MRPIEQHTRAGVRNKRPASIASFASVASLRALRAGGARRHRGFLMMEIIVGMALMGMALLIFTQLQSRHQNTEAGRVEGETMLSAQAVFAQYFMANRTEMLDAMAAVDADNANVQRHCLVRVGSVNNPAAAPGNGTIAWNGGPAINDGLKTCAIDLSLLQARNMWPRGFNVTHMSPETGGAWRHAAIFRRARGAGPDLIMNNADDVLTNDVEMLMVRMDEDGILGAINPATWRSSEQVRTRALAAMGTLGQSGGFVPIGVVGPCRAVGAAGANNLQACGPGWTTDLRGWITSTHANTLVGALP